MAEYGVKIHFYIGVTPRINYSPLDKDITALLSCQDVRFLKRHIFSVPDDHSQLITKINI